MDEDAIAPVIAVLLILAIIVTFFSVYTAVYLPGLKQQAEVEHLREVESGLLKFSSDIDNAISWGASYLSYSEQVPLGGGEILLNSLKSSGTIQVQNEKIGVINISLGGYSPTTIPLSLVNYTYNPIGNFWEDQGYSWQMGYVNITKGSRKIPLQYYNATDPELNETIRDLALKIVRLTVKDSNPGNYTVRIISIIKSEKNMISSNGIAKLTLKSRDETTKYNLTAPVTNVTFSTDWNHQDTILCSEIDNILSSIPPVNNVTVQVIEMTVEVN